MKANKTIIGRREKVDLPDFNLNQIEAKMDTGAYTSALHCQKVVSDVRNGKQVVTFELLDSAHPNFKNQSFEFPVHKVKKIKSSNGSTQTRFIILTKMRLGGLDLNVEFSLADRSRMEYPILIGRKALRGKFIIDVSKKHLTEIQLQK
jgi:hypothetical protein